MLDLHSTLLATTAVINFALTIFVFGENAKNLTNRAFALFTLFLGGWALSVLGFLLLGSDNAALSALKLAYVSAALIAGCYYYFSLVFPENAPPAGWHARLAIGGTLCLCVLLLIPGFLTGAVVWQPWGREVILDMRDYLIFAGAFCALFVGGQIRLWWKFFRASGLDRRQLLAVGASVTPVGALGMYYNLVLVSPFFEDFRYIWTGPVFTSVFAVVIVYSVFRYRLFTPKALIAEVLVFALWLFIFVRILTGEAPNERMANIILLAVSIPVGILLLRSVKLEVRARERLAFANVRLQELDRAKTEFLSIATHQLRGPVTIIRGYAENLRDGTYGPLAATAKEAADHIADRGRALAGVIEDYLNVSRIELGRMQYAFTVADLYPIVARVMDDLKLPAAAAKLTLSLEVDGTGPYLAQFDAGKIAQVIQNLIDNAIKYTPHGSIHVRLARNAGKILVSVTDTGVGIEAATLPRLFQKFSRAEDANRVNSSGTGLGLYVAAQLVRAHQGRIWAESLGPGQGSTFFVELPATAQKRPWTRE